MENLTKSKSPRRINPGDMTISEFQKWMGSTGQSLKGAKLTTPAIFCNAPQEYEPYNATDSLRTIEEWMAKVNGMLAIGLIQMRKKGHPNVKCQHDAVRVLIDAERKLAEQRTHIDNLRIGIRRYYTQAVEYATIIDQQEKDQAELQEQIKLLIEENNDLKKGL